MAVYPFYQKLKDASDHMDKGNFGLWYNKLIPISEKNNFKVCDDKGDDKEVTDYYKKQYTKFQRNMATRKLLEQKHQNQNNFGNVLADKYETVSFKARLISPLINGIGESHPHEVSMVFDHNLGIPYIPASGMKGIVRFAHTLGLIGDIPPEKIKKDKYGKEYFDDESEVDNYWTYIPHLFGTQKKRGAVIFLDAYPETVPELHLDIMNPHYGEYYSDDKNSKPPGDYLTPNPIKFLTVARETVFIFRALVQNHPPELQEKVEKALLR
ncbi:MAG: type III-B CRISPR module RAMP protein Cmr6, partial [Desulfosalsimonas sp.]